MDLSQIDAIGPYTALRLMSEIGTDMSRWSSEKHFTSWLILAPKNKVSGGRLRSSQTMPSANRAAAILRLAAMSLGRTQTALGAFYRRLAFRVGKAKAITATARNSPSWCTAALRTDLSTTTRGQPRTTHNIGPTSFVVYANGQPISDLALSTFRPARSPTEQFLRRRPARMLALC